MLTICSRKGMTPVMACGCVHGAWDDESWSAIFEAVEAVKPRVFVLLGDLQNFDAIGKYATRHVPQLKEELHELNDGLEMVRKALPRNCRRHYIWGNHEDRFNTGVIQAGLESTVDMRTHAPEVEKWSMLDRYAYRKSCVVRVGQLDMAHGFETSATGLEREPLILSAPNRLLVHTHTHCPTDHVQRVRMGKSGPLTGHSWVDLGTVGPLEHSYGLRMRPDRLGHAFGVGYCDERVPYLHPTKEWEWTVVRYTVKSDMENAA